jgi:protein TonB
MPRDLFGDVVVPPASLRSYRSPILISSIAAHAIGGSSLLIASLSATVTLPEPPARLAFEHVRSIAVDIELPAPPRPARAPSAGTPAATPARAEPTPETAAAAPVVAPSTITPETGREGVPFAHVTPAIPSIDSGAVGDLLGVPEPLSPPAAAPAQQPPIRLHGGMRPPQKIAHVAPRYPVIAREGRVEGTVILEAIIDTSGRVESARVLRSIALLDDAALDAVRQWRFTPARLNDRPVPVVMTVTVTFTLER